MTKHNTASQGLHHVTAMASDPKRNVAFYTGLLGLRLVKKTVNFDDPSVYHLYYGDGAGSPGTILTFFPWPDAAPGTRGSGETTETTFVVPKGALERWSQRLAANRIEVTHEVRFGEARLAFADPDDMRLAIVEREGLVDLPAWATDKIDAQMAIRRIGGVTLSLASLGGTERVLADTLGYRREAEENGIVRYVSSSGSDTLDLKPIAPARSRMGAGTVHHIAFRASDDDAQARMAERLRQELHLGVTEQRDRNYFRSVYFREPGGVLFEIATDAPGFHVDEDDATLGTALKLPEQYEPYRTKIEAILPAI